MAIVSTNSAPVQSRPLLLLLGPGLVLSAAIASVFGSQLLFACFAMLGIPIGLCVCLIGLIWKPRWPHAIGLVVGLSVAAYFVAETNRLGRGELRPSEYPQMLQLASGGTTHFPRAIPANATDIRITAHGPYGWFPAQDFMIDVRYILPPAAAEQVRAQAEKASIIPDPKTHDAERSADQFIRKHGGNPADFKSYLLVIPNGGRNAGGVSVNTTTGEVIYWVFY